MPHLLKYIIVTPARNEAGFIEHTFHSLVAQTSLPSEWIIVNDGSTDETGLIIDRYSSQYPWIKSLHRENRGFRKAGGGVIEAFYHGYQNISVADWDFLVKLDADLSFGDNYFEECLAKFERNPKLGIGGGMIYHKGKDSLELEENPLFHVRGATKIYRRPCWQAIGGLVAAPGWDAIDEVKANMLGWETRSFAELSVIHHRYTGRADGRWRDAVKNGVADYVAGYHPLFLTAKCMKRMVRKPYLVGSFGIMAGFLKGYLKRMPRVTDKDFIEYIRRQQIRRLTFRSTIWK